MKNRNALNCSPGLAKRKSKRKTLRDAGKVRTCRVCGCTDAACCVLPNAESCLWVATDCCSACGLSAVQNRSWSMTFEQLRTANKARCEAVFHPVQDWSPTDWATAMAGECGEACNLIKKMRRGDAVPSDLIAKELADLIIYADLLAARLDIDLSMAVIQKFNEVSVRKGSNLKL